MYKPSFKPPKKVEYSSIERLFEIISIAVLVFSIIYAIVSYAGLPDMIPSRFGFDGTVTSYSGKSMIFLLCGINVGLYALLTVVRFFPQVWNTPIYKAASEKSIENIYKLTAELLTVIKAILCILFGFINFSTVNVEKMGSNSVMIYTMALVIILLMVTVLYVIRMGRAYKD